MVLFIEETMKSCEDWHDTFYEGEVLIEYATYRNCITELETGKYTLLVLAKPEKIPSVNEFIVKIRNKFNIAIVPFRRKDDTKTMYTYLLENSYIHSFIDIEKKIHTISYWVKDVLRQLKVDADRCTNKCLRFNSSYPQNVIKVFSIPVRLTSLEYRIVKYLILAANRRVPADEILRYAFPPNSKTSANAISVHITSINKKLFYFTNFKVICKEYGGGYYITSKNQLSAEFLDKNYNIDIDNYKTGHRFSFYQDPSEVLIIKGVMKK